MRKNGFLRLHSPGGEADTHTTVHIRPKQDPSTRPEGQRQEGVEASRRPLHLLGSSWTRLEHPWVSPERPNRVPRVPFLRGPQRSPDERVGRPHPLLLLGDQTAPPLRSLYLHHPPPLFLIRHVSARLAEVRGWAVRPTWSRVWHMGGGGTIPLMTTVQTAGKPR